MPEKCKSIIPHRHRYVQSLIPFFPKLDRVFFLTLLFTLVASSLLLGVHLVFYPGPTELGTSKVLENYGKFPLRFEANRGQTDEQVKFLSRGSGYTLFLTSTEAVMVLEKNLAEASSYTEGTHATEQIVLSMYFDGANPEPQIEGLEKLPGKANYFIGKDPAGWRTDIPIYAKVRYQDVYPGVDLDYHGNQSQLEYSFIVDQGADRGNITLGFRGADGLELDAQGGLVLIAAGEQIRMLKPSIYQEIDGIRREISGGYILQDNHQISFQVGEYDDTHPLVIDPLLVYSTYLGGDKADGGTGIAVDNADNAYVTGATGSADFPIVNPVQSVFGGGETDVIVTKISLSGDEIIYSTYLGGGGIDIGNNLAVDLSGNAYVVGYTFSFNFPTSNPLQPNHTGASSDTFIAKLNPGGDMLVYSTYLGGSFGEIGYDIALDALGSAYVSGLTDSSDFPTLNPLQPIHGGAEDAFVAKLDPSGSVLVYSTYLGGSGGDGGGSGIALDPSGNVYVVGLTFSSNFPTANALQPTIGGDKDAYITKLNPTGNAIVYSTYLGGSGSDVGVDVAVDIVGSAYLIGSTASTNFPTANPLQPSLGGIEDAFLAKLNPLGSSLIYSTYLGGSNFDFGSGRIALDNSGNAYLIGSTSSTDFPTVKPVQPTLGGERDAYVAKVNQTGSVLVYSTYLGGSGVESGFGIDVDAAGNAYVTGATSSTNFPTANPLRPALGGIQDAFLAKIALTPQEAIESIIERVGGLVDVGKLTPGQAAPLLAMLRAAIAALDVGQARAAISVLQAFTTVVQVYIRIEFLSLEDGQPLIDAANSVIELLG